MKKIFLSLTCLFTVIFLCSCSVSTNNNLYVTNDHEYYDSDQIIDTYSNVTTYFLDGSIYDTNGILTSDVEDHFDYLHGTFYHDRAIGKSSTLLSDVLLSFYSLGNRYYNQYADYYQIPWFVSVKTDESYTNVFHYSADFTEQDTVSYSILYTYNFNYILIIQILLSFFAFVLFIKFIISFGRMVLCKC